MSKNKIVTALKLPLEPDTAATSILDGQSRICNWLYNTLLDRANTLRNQFKETQDSQIARTVYTERGLRNLLPTLKEGSPFLKVVHSSPLKNSALRLSTSIQAYQKSKKGKRKGNTGWPKFRSWKASWFSLFYDEPGKGFKVEGNQLLLSLGMGRDKVRRSLPIPIKDADLLKNRTLRNLRIVKKHGIFYAVFTIEKIVPEMKPISRIIALDPNHKNLCYGVDTDAEAIEIASPHWLKTYDTRIDELKSLRDRCVRKAEQMEVLDENGSPTGKTYFRPSKRWTKFQNTLERALRKRRCQTKTFLYTTAHALFKKYDCVGIGDYTPHGNGSTTKMRRAMNNRSLIGRFKEVVSWVAIKSGKTYMEFNEAGTTRTCHSCDHSMPDGIAPDIRQWECPKCRAFHIRDENAAINGLKLVIKHVIKKYGMNFPSVSCSDLGSVMNRWAWRVTPRSVRSTLQGCSSSVITAAAGN